MKTSTFLSKVLSRFHDGKSYTTTPRRLTYANAYSFDMVTAMKKGRNNLAGMIELVAKKTGTNTTKAKLAICNALGHTSFEKFANSKNIRFSQVKNVLQYAIKYSRSQGD